MYAITATVSRETEDGWSSLQQVPTFYLDENVQGIVNEDHAGLIAFKIIDPFGVYEVHVKAVKMEEQ